MSGHLERIGRKIDALEKQLRSPRDRKIESMSTAELREYIWREFAALGFTCPHCGKPIAGDMPSPTAAGVEQ